MVKKIKILAVLQARTSSTRLPGKVLKKILDKPLLQLQIEREKRSNKIDHLIVATSDEISDKPLQELCNSIGVDCFRGNLENVLDRFYQAALIYSPEYVVRLTGDCPLVDPNLLDEIIQFCLDGNYDYATNALEPTYPDGLDVEIFRFSCLEDAWKNAKLPSQLEHVTPYINRQPEKFKIGHYKGSRDLSYLRWTVDEPEDFELVKTIYENLYPSKPEFTTSDILEFLELYPSWKTYNLKYKRNEGFIKSLEKDCTK